MKLITKEIENKAKNFPLYSQDGKRGEAVVLARFFTPWSNYTWYMLELDPEYGDAFGYVVGPEPEYGYFNVNELASIKQTIRIFGRTVEVDAVERDSSVKPANETLENMLDEHNEPVPSYWNEETATASN